MELHISSQVNYSFLVYYFPSFIFHLLSSLLPTVPFLYCLSSPPRHVRGTTDKNYPLWPGKIVTTCMIYLTTGGPSKEHKTNKLPPTGRIRKSSKGERKRQRIVLPTSQNISCWNPLWLSNACATRKDWVRMIGQRQPRNEFHYHKTQDGEPRGRALLLVPLPCCSLPRHPFPIRSLDLSACVSPWTIHFRVLDKSPPSCNKWRLLWDLFFSTIDILTTQGTQGPAHPPTDQNQRSQLGPFCPWSPLDVDDWPECPN